MFFTLGFSGFAVSAPEETVVLTFQQADSVGHPAGSSMESGTQCRTEIHYGEKKLVLVADKYERVGKDRYRATGNVVITFLDMVVTCDEAEYDERSLRLSTLGETWFRRKRISLTGSSVEFDPGTQAVILYDVSGYFYDTSGRSDREFFLTGGMVQFLKADRLQMNWDIKNKD